MGKNAITSNGAKLRGKTGSIVIFLPCFRQAIRLWTTILSKKRKKARRPMRQTDASNDKEDAVRYSGRIRVWSRIGGF